MQDQPHPTYWSHNGRQWNITESDCIVIVGGGGRGRDKYSFIIFCKKSQNYNKVGDNFLLNCWRLLAFWLPASKAWWQVALTQIYQVEPETLLLSWFVSFLKPLRSCQTLIKSSVSVFTLFTPKLLCLQENIKQLIELSVSYMYIWGDLESWGKYCFERSCDFHLEYNFSKVCWRKISQACFQITPVSGWPIMPIVSFILAYHARTAPYISITFHLYLNLLQKWLKLFLL